METIRAIMTRRSLRRFRNKRINEKKLEALLWAAMQAPSARNGQPWHFIVITDRQPLSAVPQFHSHAEMLLEAPAAIMVCGDTRIEESVEYLNTDCSAAAENQEALDRYHPERVYRNRWTGPVS